MELWNGPADCKEVVAGGNQTRLRGETKNNKILDQQQSCVLDSRRTAALYPLLPIPPSCSDATCLILTT